MAGVIKGVTAAEARSLDKPWRRTQLGLRKRPWARSYIVSVFTPTGPPEELVAITRALTRELRQGAAPRSCAGWLALRDWIEAHADAVTLGEFDEIDSYYGARTLKQALAVSGLSRPRQRPRPRP